MLISIENLNAAHSIARITTQWCSRPHLISFAAKALGMSLMLDCWYVSTDGQAANKDTSQDREEVADIHSHNGQHAARQN